MDSQIKRKGLKAAKSRKRVKYACKPDLQELIEFANILPPDLQLKNINDLVESAFTFARPGSPQWIEAYKRRDEAFWNYLKTLPEEFQGIMHDISAKQNEELNLWAQSLPSNSENAEVQNQYWLKRIEKHKELAEVYEKFKWVRETLYKLIEIGENIEEHVGKKLDVALGVFFVEYAYLDKDGRIRRQPDKFAETLEGVELFRLRACLVCRKIFWANRIDKKCCSEVHSAVIRQRQSRESKKERGKLYSKFAKRRKQKNETSINGAGSTGQKGE